ncbi:polymer-forming cytoskeletal protein [uncultured Amphritea sp.]|uniref:bactofilin family protein n=1 Tax=uncultured Amphritea sp. TaxID=981605 RepID=UPI0026019D3F|nr:polymer-forming cytoskeletal protein [uncultured Amphritea sp.]
MGFFTKNVPAKSGVANSSAITIIAEGNKFSGDMSIIGRMHIDGTFEGNISSLDNISIGKSGHVHGVVKANQITVCGLLEGEVVCDQLEIDRGGKVVATVISKIMAIHPEGNFIGERRMKEVGVLEHAPQMESGIDAIDSLPDKVTIKAEKESA